MYELVGEELVRFLADSIDPTEARVLCSRAGNYSVNYAYNPLNPTLRQKCPRVLALAVADVLGVVSPCVSSVQHILDGSSHNYRDYIPFHMYCFDIDCSCRRMHTRHGYHHTGPSVLPGLSPGLHRVSSFDVGPIRERNVRDIHGCPCRPLRLTMKAAEETMDGDVDMLPFITQQALRIPKILQNIEPGIRTRRVTRSCPSAVPWTHPHRATAAELQS